MQLGTWVIKKTKQQLSLACEKCRQTIPCMWDCRQTVRKLCLACENIDNLSPIIWMCFICACFKSRFVIIDVAVADVDSGGVAVTVGVVVVAFLLFLLVLLLLARCVSVSFVHTSPCGCLLVSPLPTSWRLQKRTLLDIYCTSVSTSFLQSVHFPSSSTQDATERNKPLQVMIRSSRIYWYMHIKRERDWGGGGGS